MSSAEAQKPIIWQCQSLGNPMCSAPQPDGSFASLPAWMTELAASRFEISDEPHFPLHILRSMRAEADALLAWISTAKDSPNSRIAKRFIGLRILRSNVIQNSAQIA